GREPPLGIDGAADLEVGVAVEREIAGVAAAVDCQGAGEADEVAGGNVEIAAIALRAGTAEVEHARQEDARTVEGERAAGAVEATALQPHVGADGDVAGRRDVDVGAVAAGLTAVGAAAVDGSDEADVAARVDDREAAVAVVAAARHVDRAERQRSTGGDVDIAAAG